MNSQVEQVDREAAARFYGRYLSRPGEVPVAGAMSAGKIDDSPLVKAFARHRLASLASQPPVLDEREVKRAFTFAFAVGFQWASKRSCVSAASIDEAWSEYTAIRNLGGPDDVA